MSKKHKRMRRRAHILALQLSNIQSQIEFLHEFRRDAQEQLEYANSQIHSLFESQHDIDRRLAPLEEDRNTTASVPPVVAPCPYYWVTACPCGRPCSGYFITCTAANTAGRTTSGM